MEHLFTANKILWSTSVFIYMIFPQHNPGKGQLHPHFTRGNQGPGDRYHNWPQVTRRPSDFKCGILSTISQLYLPHEDFAAQRPWARRRRAIRRTLGQLCPGNRLQMCLVPESRRPRSFLRGPDVRPLLSLPPPSIQPEARLLGTCPAAHWGIQPPVMGAWWKHKLVPPPFSLTSGPCLQVLLGQGRSGQRFGCFPAGNPESWRKIKTRS